MNLKAVIKNFPDFPKKGVLFRDIVPILRDAKAFDYTIKQICKSIENTEFNLIAAIESRGFIFGGVLAYNLNKGFVPIRKEGKLPGKTLKLSYDIEYGNAIIEIQEDSIKKGQKILIFDDLLATGGTAKAAAQLVEKIGGIVIGFIFIIELTELKGREKLTGYPVFSLIKYR